jgi:hypothetical protein
MSLLYSEFVSAVEAHLAVEANRRGLATFRAKYMVNAMVDLQRFIRSYREANKSIYTSGDVAIESHAHLVPMPTGAKPKACYIYSIAEDDDQLCRRYRLNYYPWERKEDLICGKLDFMSWWGCCWPEGGCPPATESDCTDWLRKAYVYSISPMSRNFLIYPQLTASTRLLLIWDGYKTTFADDDEINLPLEAAEAVASYILWKITLNVDKSPQLAALHAAEYARQRLSLFRDFQESVQDMDQKDEEFGATNIAMEDALFGFGAVTIPFLTVVTQHEGVTNAAMANIPTLNIETPYTVQVLIDGEQETWVLMAGSDATDVANGILRGNDWSVSNAKVWYQNSI